MEDLKPGFFEYLKAQNRSLYKITGIAEVKTGVLFAETKFARNKCIIDFILLISCFTILILGISLIISILTNIYTSLNQLYNNHTVYDPNIGSKYFLNIMPIHICALSLFYFIAPSLMKVVRILSGIRWFFVKFEKTDKPDKTANGLSGKINYLEFYNNRIAFQSDNFFYGDSKKVKELKYRYFENNGIAELGKFIARVYQLFMLVLFLCPYITIYYSIEVTIILYAGLIVLYFLSHIFAYSRWKNYFNKPSPSKTELEID